MTKNILLILLLLFSLACYHDRSKKDLILFSFESDNELDKIHWKCHTLFSLSDEHVTNGNKSLKMELYPSQYPGLTPIIVNKDWHQYGYLGMDLYNPEKNVMRITVRIDDRENPDYEDRYNYSFTLVPGLNRMNIPLKNIITSGTNRKLDLKNIRCLVIFMVNPSKKVTLYIDYIRLAT